MAAFDWVNRLFPGGEQTRGLSGAMGGAVALDDANSFYNYRLRRHYTDADIALEPERIWHTNDDPDARTGMGVHVSDVLTDGQRFTDVMVILSGEDYDHAMELDPGFANRVTRVLGDAYERFVRQTAFPPPTRRLGVWLVREGSPEIGGADFGLVDGEFITGMVPNLYRGPGDQSRPVLALHANLPGVWNGYREIGRLYDDQLLFSLGNHWLDNFHHPSFQESALYRLGLDEDGGFFHIVNPDLQDRYQVTTTEQDGVSVITLSTRDGEALAHLVFWSFDADASDEALVEEAPTEELELELERAPDIAPPMMLDGAEMVVEQLPRSRGPKTIIPEAHKERIFTLQERGALLQRVHFGAFMLGYDVYVGSRGEVGTAVREPAATFQVRKRTVSLLASGDGVSVDGEAVPRGESRLIEGDAFIEVGGQRLDYRDLRSVDADGWPYVGEIRRPASSTYMLWGREYAIGRSRECRVVLPDEPQNANIVWKPKVGAGATIRSKTGEIPKSRFYTDSIMVASEHGAVELTQDVPSLVCSARHCYAYIRRAGDVLALYPTTSGKMPQRLGLEPGDEVLIGNCLFHVGFTPSEMSMPARVPAPAPSMPSSAALGAMSSPDLEEEPPSAFEPETIERDNDVLSTSWSDTGSAGPSSLSFEPGLPHEGISNLPPVFDDDEGVEIVLPPTPPLAAVSKVEAAQEDLPEVEPEALVEVEPEALVEVEPEALVEVEPEALVEVEPEALVEVEPEALDAGDDAVVESIDEVTDTTSASPADEDVVTLSELDAPMPGAFAGLHLPGGEAPIELESPVAPRGLDAPEAPARVEKMPKVAQAAPESVSGPHEVVCVDDSDAQFELGRPARLVLQGWVVKGTAICGNHAGADLVVPENRIEPDQTFAARDYFSVRIRGRKGRIAVIEAGEVRVDGAAPESNRYDSLEGLTVSVVRRDEEGDEDFMVDLSVEQDGHLPDPRSRLVRIDTGEPLTLALVAKGLPLRSPEQVTLGPITCTATFDGERLTLSAYLASYRTSTGFQPFLVQHGDGPFRTAPEDGSPIVLQPGDRLVLGTSMVQFSVNG